ncbi:MAG TPA: excinuclease ABC subunit UvrC, partial [Nitrospiria bacterium]|nr:excinuclease ABC subunit UvrC [Nitrospiria bacterium]
MEAPPDIKSKVSLLPSSPGVYLFKNSRDTVIYVGKAISLKDRVRSYFQDQNVPSVKTAFMVSQIADLEYIATGSELEAFLLESNLIKKHRPKFNVMLRDDKQYPYLCLPVTEDFPRLKIVRKVKKDGNLYFGPYIPSGALKSTLNWIRRYFPLATCKIEIDGKAERPCLEYQIKRCMAPCTGYQSREEYQKIVGQVRLFLEGKDKDLVRLLSREMERLAEAQAFEEAGRVRDRIANIESVLEKQRISSTDLEDQDVIFLAREGKYADLQILFVRGGLLVGRGDYFWDNLSGETDEEIYQTFLEQYYAKDRLIPPEIFVPKELSDRSLIEKWLTEKRGRSVTLKSPSRGKDYQLLKLADENARLSLNGRVAAKEGELAILKQAETFLGLPRLPHRIEAVDIS